MYGICFGRVTDIFAVRKCELNTHWCNFNFVKEEYHKQGISKAMTDLAVEKVSFQ